MSALLAASCLLGSLLQGLSPAAAEEVVATVLLEAGGAPSQALRLAQRPGWGQRARLTVSLEVDTVLDAGPGGELRTEYGPEVVVPLRLELPESGGGPAGARYVLRVGRPEVLAGEEAGVGPAWRLVEELGAVRGREGTVVLSPTGALVEAWLEPRQGASQALRSLVGAALSSDWLATPRFPEEPVGPGARWAVARSHGGTLSVITYELVELRGPRGRVRFLLQALRPGGHQEPVAEGELRFDLRRPLPERLEALYTFRASLTLGDARRRLEVVRRTRVRLEAEGLEPLPREVMEAFQR